MSVEKLKENVYWVGVKNPELRVFDIIMETKRGTTYNSYLIVDDKIAVVDSVKDGYADEQLENIKAVIGDRKVDYIIVQHTELDHSGSLFRLIEEYPEACIVGSRAAIMYSKQIANRDFKSMEAKEDLKLGETTLKFISAPNLHWPDTIFTYAENKKLLFTCDFTGCHYCPKGAMTGGLEDDYFEEMKYYFDVIMGPFKKFVLAGLSKIKGLEIEMVAPSHGPIHVEDAGKFLKLYEEWAQPVKAEDKNVQIFYISAYGDTEKMAEFFANKINKKGIKAETYEITSHSLTELIEKVETANGIMIGSPTINQDAVKPAWDLLSLICPITNRGKAAAAFGSYGWSGEGVGMLTDRLTALKLKTVKPGFKFNFVPSEEEYKKAEEFLDEFLTLI